MNIPHRPILEQEIFSLLRDLSDPLSALSPRSAAEAIVNHVKSIVARALNQMNQTSLYQRLPKEVWCAAWEYLSLEYRVAVSQVCTDWRDAAINDPHLWTSIILRPKPYSSERVVTNTAAASRHIARAGALPWSLLIDRELETWGYPGLYKMWGPYWQRLRSLTIVVNDIEDQLNDFLSLFVELPALHSFTMRAAANSWTRTGGGQTEPWQTNIRLPELHSFVMQLHRDQCERLPRFIEGVFQPFCPKVQRVTTPFRVLNDLRTILQAFPNAKELELELVAWSPKSGDEIDIAAVRERLRRTPLDSIRIQNIKYLIPSARVFVSLLQGLDIAQLHLECKYPDTASQFDSSVAVRLIDLLANVESPERFDIQLFGNMASFEVSKADRGVSFIVHPHNTQIIKAPFLGGGLWASLHPSAHSSLTYVCVDWVTLATVIKTCPVDFKTIRSIRIDCRGESVWMWLEAAEPVPPHIADSVKEFGLCGFEEQPVPLGISPPQAISRLRHVLSLDPGKKLKHICFEDIQGIHDPIDVWDGIAETLVIV